VVSEIDYAWTYVGGCTDLIDTLVRDARLEVFPIKMTDRHCHDDDVLNAALGGEVFTRRPDRQA
jgi:hypothetical protein